jgi:hypothetical protein
MSSPVRFLLFVVLLALVGGSAQAQGTMGFSAAGRLLGPGGEPVPCCDVVVQVRMPGPGGDVFSEDVARTRGDGTFLADDLFCAPDLDLEVVAIPICCDGESAPVPIVDCLDPNTGLPLDELQLGDVGCLDAPMTGRSLLTGLTVCRDGVFLEPVADCAMLLRFTDLVDDGGLTWTGADGTWEICTDCDAGGFSPDRTVVAQCCDETQIVSTDGCPERVEVPDFVCEPCPVPPCDQPREIEVHGRVLCADPGGGPPTPIADCPVEVRAFNDCMEEVGPFDVVTDADGRWVVCLPCPVNEDCRQQPNLRIQANATCCVNGSTSEIFEGCAPVLQLRDKLCQIIPPGDDCRVAPSCAAGESLVTGTLTCIDGGGSPVPVADCPITVACPGGVTVDAVTASDGSYSACVPCAGCDSALVTAACCDAQSSADLTACPAVARADLACVDCPPPPRPCPPPEAMQVGGSVLCSQGDGSVTALAGCEVTLAAVSAGGLPLDPIVTTTAGDGSYLDCVPCGPDGLSELTATADCCGAQMTLPVDGCPETQALDPLLCEGCSPCPDGMTRIQGRVHCRGSGSVAGCTVRINVTTCEGEEVYFAETDSEGRYRLCAPCPCAGTDVRVTAECCAGTTVRAIDACGPITPMRTIFCGSGCP